LARCFFNPHVLRDAAYRGLFTDDEYRDVRAYYEDHAAFPPTPLRALPSLARDLGLGPIYAKDETHRFGVNAFKIVGVLYAVHRLGDAALARGLVCATAGNHGRAVARVARLRRGDQDAGAKELPCTVFVPAVRSSDPREVRTRNARVAAMQADRADVIDVDGTYEEAVQQAEAFGRLTGATIVSDTSWEGYEQIPRWIMAGYTQILEEASTQWDLPPTAVVVQGGVGGLVCAAASWFAHRFRERRPYFIAAEPENAACLMMSARAGRAITIDSSLDTIMAGLRCAAPSPLAWPSIAAGVDAFVSVPDSAAVEAMDFMSHAPDGERIDAGPSGACGLGALMQIARAPARSATGLDRSSRVLVVVTEGA
jgi:diaminopropionate ammonia-lyase